LNRNSELFNGVVDWLKSFPRSFKPTERENVRQLVCYAFDLSPEQLDEYLNPSKPNGHAHQTNGELKPHALELELELARILPTRGLLGDYIEYTKHSEAPLAYHVFGCLCGIGACLNRKVWFDMGIYRVYPTLGVVILGPSGIKKTSATNIVVELLQQTEAVKVYSEKLTPEALIDAMKNNAVGLIYAPELTVFINKKQYNEGLIQLITRFMDCPNTWESGTIGRGQTVLHNIAISSLMCSTLDWFVRATPEDSFGGGFIARNLLVVQTTRTRIEPIPKISDPNLRDKLVDHMHELLQYEGQIKFSNSALQHYIDWYRTDHQHDSDNPEHELLATYHNRKPDHVKRLAICLHFSSHGTLELCDECFTTALHLLRWLEQFLPEMLKQLFKSPVGEFNEQVLRHITNHSPMPHSDLVRKMSGRISAAELRTVVQSLKEANLITEHVDNIGHYYEVTTT